MLRSLSATAELLVDIKQDIDSKSHFFILPALDAPVRGPRRNIAIPFGMETLEWHGYPKVIKL